MAGISQLDGQSYHTGNKQSSCNNTTPHIKAGPNPVYDKLETIIVADDASPVTINIFDNKGALVKRQHEHLLSGSNHLSADMTLLHIQSQSLL